MKIAVVFGTRPEAIKLAPVIHKLSSNDFEVVIINTGQHRELLQHVIDFFKIKPNYNLGCMNPNLITNSARIVSAINVVLQKEKPNCTIVQGDTLTCYLGAYVSFLNKIPVMHVEAGLRSFDKFSPFPEEMFRRLTDQLCDVAFAPTPRAARNLLDEGFPEDRIVLTGNTVVDAVEFGLRLLNREEIEENLSQILGIPLGNFDKVVFITSHRRENIGKPMKNIRYAVKELAEEHPNIAFIWSLHKNPQVRETIMCEKINTLENLFIVEPLTYPQTLFLMDRSELIITDSGGIQEEACVLKKPVLIVRNTSERPEVVEVGLGFIVGTNKERIISTFNEVLPLARKISEKEIRNPYGDGKASERIKDFLKCSKVEEFIQDYKNMYRENLYECSQKFSMGISDS